MRSLGKLLASAFIVLGLVFSPAAVSAQGTFDGVCKDDNGKDRYPLGATGPDIPDVCEDPSLTDPAPADNPVGELLARITIFLGIIIGIIGTIMVVVGGLRYATSGGNPETTKAARQLVITGLSGIVIYAMAGVAVNFIVSLVT